MKKAQIEMVKDLCHISCGEEMYSWENSFMNLMMSRLLRKGYLTECENEVLVALWNRLEERINRYKQKDTP